MSFYIIGKKNVNAHIDKAYLEKLHRRLRDDFSQDELKALSLYLGIEYDMLPGTGKDRKARELVMYIDRRGQLAKLVNEVAKLRPEASQSIMPGDIPSEQLQENSVQLVLTEPAREVVNSASDKELAKAAILILAELQVQLDEILNAEDLPPFRAFEAEDGSLLIEWIFTHFRIGFSIEPDKKDSGWFLVSDDTAGRINASGHLLGVNIRRLTTWLIAFATDFYSATT
jgi:hypothetical protein